MAKKRLLVSVRDVTPGNYVTAMFRGLFAHFDLTIEVEKGGGAEKALTNVHHVAFAGDIDRFDAVLLGCSTPNELESQRLHDANTLGLPTVGICDGYGSHTRHRGAFCKHYLVPNDWVRESLPDGVGVVVGDINARPLSSPSPAMRGAFEKVRGGRRVIVWSAQKTLEDLERVVSDMSIMKDAMLVMGLHPSPERWPDRSRVEKLTSGLSGRAYTTTEIAPELNTLGAIACLNPERDFVVGSYGGALTTAAYNGYRVVLVEGPNTWAHLREAFPGAEEHQLRTLAHVPVLLLGEPPLDWGDLVFPSREEVKSVILPFEAGRAVRAVCELA